MVKKTAIRRLSKSPRSVASPTATDLSSKGPSPSPKPSSPLRVSIAATGAVSLVIAAGRSHVFPERSYPVFPDFRRLSWPRIGQPGHSGRLKPVDPPDRGAAATTLRGAKLRQRRKQIFIGIYTEVGSVRAAAVAAGIAPETHANWLRTDDAYALGFALAGDMFLDAVRAKAIELAFGVLKPKCYRGRPIMDPLTGNNYAELDHSDGLLVALLQTFSPEDYGPRPRVVPTSQAERRPIRVRDVTFEELHMLPDGTH